MVALIVEESPEMNSIRTLDVVTTPLKLAGIVLSLAAILVMAVFYAGVRLVRGEKV
jgi:hypothetical protein